MLDIALFRTDQGGNPDIVRENQRRRFADVGAVDVLLAADDKRRTLQYQGDRKREEVNKLKREIGQKMKAKEDASELIKQKTALEAEEAELKAQTNEQLAVVNGLLKPFGNIVHASVPVSNDEEKDNAVVSLWGERRMEPGLLTHPELLYRIGGVDYARGTRVAGARGYFLKGVGVQLNYAILNYAMSFLRREREDDGDRPYVMLQTPFFMKKDVMAKTAQLAEFDEALYKVSTGSSETAAAGAAAAAALADGKAEAEDADAAASALAKAEAAEKYLIATSEQPISAYHAGETLEAKSLPLRYAGISTCFRKEAGSSGRDVAGIFRVHQFEKVEQFCVTSPENSWAEHERMRRLAEEFHQSLGLAYRVVVIVSGELNNAAAKKYDLEAWFPGNTDRDPAVKDNQPVPQFRELVSCSNCTDYQSRSLGVRFVGGAQGKGFVHMLNSTLTATTRAICCILETHQTPTGINIPEPLQPFMDGKTFIPFVNDGLNPPKAAPNKKGGKGKAKAAPKKA